MVVCQHHLDRFRDPEGGEAGRMRDTEVDRAAGKVVSGLSLSRLIELENKTSAMLRSGQPVDGEFWDLVLKMIHVEKAIVRLPLDQVNLTLMSLVEAKLDSRSRLEEPSGTVQETTAGRRSKSPG